MSEAQADIILRTVGLAKRYGGVHALEDANFELRAGEHIAIVGDNGAGKSTFVRQITGVEQPSAGEIFFDGRKVEFKSPIEARDHGIETVFRTWRWPTTSTCPPTCSSAARSATSTWGRSAS